jgi:hypothetical protein
MAAHRYITEVVEPHVVPLAPFTGDEFLLMDDNARPHIARLCKITLQRVPNIARMVWPPRSPDLNPIKHIWDNMLREVRIELFNRLL